MFVYCKMVYFKKNWILCSVKCCSSNTNVRWGVKTCWFENKIEKWILNICFCLFKPSEGDWWVEMVSNGHDPGQCGILWCSCDLLCSCMAMALPTVCVLMYPLTERGGDTLPPYCLVGFPTLLQDLRGRLLLVETNFLFCFLFLINLI